MNTPNEIENSLHRLLPAPLSERGHQNISQMLADLAARNAASSADNDSVALPIQRNHLMSHKGLLAMAAVFVLAAIPAWITFNPQLNSLPKTANASEKASFRNIDEDSKVETVLIDRLSITNQADLPRSFFISDGSVMEEINRQVHTRERYRTGKSGYVVTISESRAEKVFVPKSSF